MSKSSQYARVGKLCAAILPAYALLSGASCEPATETDIGGEQEFAETTQALTLPSTTLYNKTRGDLLAAHFDMLGDPDDIQGTVALRMVLNAYDLDAMLVVGASSFQQIQINEAGVPVLNQAFGKECTPTGTASPGCGLSKTKGWANAHLHWAANPTSNLVKDAALTWKTALNATGGTGEVWIAEGGMSDFTYDVAKYLVDYHSFTKAALRARVHVIQHSDWNMNKSHTGWTTTPNPMYGLNQHNYQPAGTYASGAGYPLPYAGNTDSGYYPWRYEPSADYDAAGVGTSNTVPVSSLAMLADYVDVRRIKDGNGATYGRPENTSTTLETQQFRAHALTTKYARLWQLAWDAESTPNRGIPGWTDHVADFSDHIEVAHILGIKKEINDFPLTGSQLPIERFSRKYGNLGEGVPGHCGNGVLDSSFFEKAIDCGGQCLPCVAAGNGEPIPWTEDFSTGLSNGATYDNGSTSWFAPYIARVLNGELEIFDSMEAEAIPSTNKIALNGATVNIGLRVRSTGTLETSDYLRLYKRVDGGADVLIGGVAGGTTGQTILGTASGQSLQLVVRANVNSSLEKYYLDDLMVTTGVICNGNGVTDNNETGVDCGGGGCGVCWTNRWGSAAAPIIASSTHTFTSPSSPFTASKLKYCFTRGSTYQPEVFEAQAYNGATLKALTVTNAGAWPNTNLVIDGLYHNSSGGSNSKSLHPTTGTGCIEFSTPSGNITHFKVNHDNAGNAKLDSFYVQSKP